MKRKFLVYLSKPEQYGYVMCKLSIANLGFNRMEHLFLTQRPDCENELIIMTRAWNKKRNRTHDHPNNRREVMGSNCIRVQISFFPLSSPHDEQFITDKNLCK